MTKQTTNEDLCKREHVGESENALSRIKSKVQTYFDSTHHHEDYPDEALGNLEKAEGVLREIEALVVDSGINARPKSKRGGRRW